MSLMQVKCILCGTESEIGEEHKEYKKIQKEGGKVYTFICDICSNRVRYEADEKKKQPKPI